MKTRRANQIMRSVARGTAIYPRHVLRAAGSQLMRHIPIGGFDGVDFTFWPCGPIAAHPHVGRMIPDIITECVKLSRVVGVPVETTKMNGTFAWISPTDTPAEAIARWRSSVDWVESGPLECSVCDRTFFYAGYDGKCPEHTHSDGCIRCYGSDFPVVQRVPQLVSGEANATNQ